MNQVRIAVMSSAGGTGKSTVAVNTAYQLARLQKTVAVIDCDPNGSLALFTGLDDPNREKTLDRVLDRDFDGNWPLFPVWPEKIDGVSAVLGGLPLYETGKRLDQEPRGVYMLADALEDAPLPQDVIIFDCPGTIERYHELVLAACTHILIVIHPNTKAINAGFKLIEWIYDYRQRLRLRPPPQVLGIVPNAYQRNAAMHRNNMGEGSADPSDTLPGILEVLPENITLFAPIREIKHLANSTDYGLPLGIYRPGEKTNLVFSHIAENIISVLDEG
jgi:chromosome partitioning protein